MNLDPKVVKMRDALIERIKDKSPKEIANIVNEILLNESNNINRLAALSARVELLKKHIKSTFNLDDKKRSIRNVEKFNLTDGLDGLLSGCSSLIFTGLATSSQQGINGMETWKSVKMEEGIGILGVGA